MCLKLAPITKTSVSLSHIKGLHRTIQHCMHIPWAYKYILLILKSKFRMSRFSWFRSIWDGLLDVTKTMKGIGLHYIEWCYVCLNPTGFTIGLIWLARLICHGIHTTFTTNNFGNTHRSTCNLDSQPPLFHKRTPLKSHNPPNIWPFWNGPTTPSLMLLSNTFWDHHLIPDSHITQPLKFCNVQYMGNCWKHLLWSKQFPSPLLSIMQNESSPNRHLASCPCHMCPLLGVDS